MKKRVLMIIVACFLVAVFYVLWVGRPLTFDRDNSLSFTLSEDIKNILYYASMAPSGHNTQPWRLEYDSRNDTFKVSLDAGRALPQVDPLNRESFISVGAFLENLRQAALAFGYQPSIRVFSELEADGEIAEVTLGSKGDLPAKNELILNRILARHTDKRKYSDKPLPEAALETIVGKNKQHIKYYAKGTVEYDYLARNTLEAMRVQAHDEEKRAELAHWFRFSNAEALETRDGLPAEQIGLKGPLKALFYTFYNREKAAREEFAIEAVDRTVDQINSASGFFILTGPSDFQGVIYSGMTFERFWLDCVAEGVSLQPMSQILEEEPFAGRIMVDLNLDAPVQMVVRAGMNEEYGENYRVRRSIAAFTEKMKNM